MKVCQVIRLRPIDIEWSRLKGGLGASLVRVWTLMVCLLLYI